MTPAEPAYGLSRAVLASALPAAVNEPFERDFDVHNVTAVRHDLQTHAHAAGLNGEQLDDFVIAVHELLTNAIRHAGGHGRLRLRRDGENLLCDVTDHGPGFADAIPASATPPAAGSPGGRGLWLARILTDTLLINDSPNGVTVTVTTCLTSRPAATTPEPAAAEHDDHT